MPGGRRASRLQLPIPQVPVRPCSQLMLTYYQPKWVPVLLHIVTDPDNFPDPVQSCTDPGQKITNYRYHFNNIIQLCHYYFPGGDLNWLILHNSTLSLYKMLNECKVPVVIYELLQKNSRLIYFTTSNNLFSRIRIRSPQTRSNPGSGKNVRIRNTACTLDTGTTLDDY